MQKCRLQLHVFKYVLGHVRKKSRLFNNDQAQDSYCANMFARFDELLLITLQMDVIDTHMSVFCCGFVNHCVFNMTLEVPSLRNLARVIMNVMCHGNLPQMCWISSLLGWYIYWMTRFLSKPRSTAACASHTIKLWDYESIMTEFLQSTHSSSFIWARLHVGGPASRTVILKFTLD